MNQPSGDRDRFNALLDDLRERQQDAYKREEHYFLKWRITNELVAGRTERVSTLMQELAPLASKQIDAFNRAETFVAYHGHLAVLVKAMRLAWPVVKSSSDIVPWGIDEFCTRAITYEMLHHASGISGPAASDSSPAQRIEFFSHVDAAQVDLFLANLSDWPGRIWTMSDFQLPPPRRDREDEEEGIEEVELDEPGGILNLYHLTVQFLAYLRRFEGVPYSKGELARRDLHRFIMERHEGKLEYRESMLEAMQRDLDRERGRRRPPVRKFRDCEHLLVPDPERLEHYLASLLDLMNQLYHRAGALFEIIPPWLRFLESRRLIDSGMREKALEGLEPLAQRLSRLFNGYLDDPTPGQALARWTENAARSVPE